MHCEDPVAPCAQVCPALAILITPEGVVQQADPSRCIGCANCVYACPFGVPKFDVEARLMKKCNLCYDRTSQELKPWCAPACPTQAIWYGDYEEFVNERQGNAVNVTNFGAQGVRTKVYHVLPNGTARLDVAALLAESEAGAETTGSQGGGMGPVSAGRTVTSRSATERAKNAGRSISPSSGMPTSWCRGASFSGGPWAHPVRCLRVPPYSPRSPLRAGARAAASAQSSRRPRFRWVECTTSPTLDRMIMRF